ncbi:MAG TPA: AAA family ATPase, partial [Blastocatellia bacterium]|nr:AAA family ATPase [Blastocatellia bacterium]
DQLSEVWPKCMNRDIRAFRVTSAFWRILQRAATAQNASLILTDLGPNLGAINRAALIAADFVAVPLAPDLFSVMGVQNLGPRLREWRQSWAEMLEKSPLTSVEMPPGGMMPIGFVLLQPPVRMDRPVQAYDRWIGRIQEAYERAVLDGFTDALPSIGNDPNCLALLRHYRSLMPLAQEAHKPIFHLKPADGAMGAHYQAVQRAYKDFRGLAVRIAERTGLEMPSYAFPVS